MAKRREISISFSAKEAAAFGSYLAVLARREAVAAMINEGVYRETCRKRAEMLLSTLKKLHTASEATRNE